MLAIHWRKYRSLILCSILFFYLGCKFTTTFIWADCTDPVNRKNLIESGKGKGEYVQYVGPKSKYSDVQFAVLILSGPYNKPRRDTIRSTWMRLSSNLRIQNGEIVYKWNHTLSASFVQSLHPNFIKFFFVVGTQTLSTEQALNLVSENERTKDLLLLEDLEDGYIHLSEKMARTLEWFSHNMNNIKYLIKSDDDSFVRVDLIVRDLVAFAPEMSDPDISKYVSFKGKVNVSPHYLYWGYFNGRANVYYKGKWEEKEWFLCDHYLPYALGGGYIISKYIVDFIGRNHQMFSRYNSEDVSMGVWTAALRGIHRVHDIRFDTEWISRGCSNNMLVRHKQTSANIVKMFKNLVQTKGDRLCMPDETGRRNYMYNWDVLPSQCCKT